MAFQGINNRNRNPATGAMGLTGQPGATPPPNAAPAGPPQVQAQTVDLTNSNQQFGQQRDQLQQGANNAVKFANWQNAMGNRAAANSAARAGLAAGGASYLASNRQAQLNSANNMNNVFAQNANAMAGSFGQQAGVSANAAGQNAGFAQSANQFNVGTQLGLDQQKADADAKLRENQATGSVAQIEADFNYLFDQKNEKGKGQYNSLKTAYQNALATGSPQEQQAAYAKLMAFITPYQQQRAASSR
jgi:hypothetical protein